MPKKHFEDPEYAEAAADEPVGDETAVEQAEAGASTTTGGDEAVAAAQKERDAYKEQFLRAVADFDNYR